MSTLKAYKNEWKKVENVILSCKTEEQLEAAFKYFKLFCKKHNENYLTYPGNVNGAYIKGRLQGALVGMIQQYI